MKDMLREYVSRRLSAAPESVAKEELVEELAENLSLRYEELMASGVEQEEALERAKDALGDTDELVEYLAGMEPDEPLPQPVRDESDVLNEVVRNVEDIVKTAVGRARQIFGEARDTVKEARAKSAPAENVEDAELVEDVEAAEAEKAEKTPKPGGWKVSMGYDNESGKFHAGAGRGADETHTFEVDSEEIKAVVKDAMKEIKKAVKGAGSVMRDAFDTASDAARDAYEDVRDEVTGREDVSTDGPIEAEALKGIEVQTAGGEVTIRMTRQPEDDVLVGGDVEELEVFRTRDGVLVIRPIQTAASSFLCGRGISGSSADVELELPARFWEFLRVRTASGDVEIECKAAVGLLECRTASGSVDFSGSADDLRVETVSGDMDLRGDAQYARLKTVSGEVDFRGSVDQVRMKSVSGDLTLYSGVTPSEMDVTTTSGDCFVRIPGSEPFRATLRTVSGEFESDFFQNTMKGRESTFTYMGGGERHYRINSVSGDLTLKKY